jgi:hypothetical protein
MDWKREILSFFENLEGLTTKGIITAPRLRVKLRVKSSFDLIS